MLFQKVLLLLLSLFFMMACHKDDEPVITDELEISYVYIGENNLLDGQVEDIPVDETVEIRFNFPLNTISASEFIKILDQDNNEIAGQFSFFSEDKLVKIDHPEWDVNVTYTLLISDQLTGAKGESFSGAEYSFTTLIPPLILESILIDGNEVNPLARIIDIDRDPNIELRFNSSITASDVFEYASFGSNGNAVGFQITQVDNKTLSCVLSESLEGFSKNQFSIASTLQNKIGRPFERLELVFYAQADTSYKFPEISDDELLTLIQKQTFKFFWDLAITESGLMPERFRPTNPNSTNVTFGGSGFGVMSIIVAIERGFITRQEGLDRWEQITQFLLTKAATFHGAWPHWMNGNTGEVNKFGEQDGGDIVETSFMIQGLLTVRQYLDATNSQQEADIIDNINQLWHAVEFDFFQQEGEAALTWNWSPNNGFLPLRIRGWNEALIIYVLAASSPTHPVSEEAYHEGWARNGGMENSNGNSYYGYTLPLRTDMGGPLFFAHYSFLGLDPRNLSDQYANYWEQNVTHARINHAYCVDNPGRYVGYSDACWGLTASDGYSGYSAHSPNNDKGVIAPTAAVASLPYTPEESLAAIRYFYYILGDKIWGDYGFQDAFDFTNGWVDSDNIGIDQGPQIIMIENYRSGLLWDLFMSAPEIQAGLTKLGFSF